MNQSFFVPISNMYCMFLADDGHLNMMTSCLFFLTKSANPIQKKVFLGSRCSPTPLSLSSIHRSRTLKTSEPPDLVVMDFPKFRLV